MRVYYFDGIKGLAALIVMLNHFVLCFSSLSYLQYVPVVGMLFDGGMAVYMFVLLSAFGICCSLNKDDVDRTIVSVVIRRYFRLTLPLILPSLLAFVVLIIGWNYNLQVGNMSGNDWTIVLLPENAQLKQLTSGILVGVLKGSALIKPLWMMKYIYLGTFLAIPFFYTQRKIRNIYIRFAYLSFFAILFYSVSPYYSATFLGIMLHQLHQIKTANSGMIPLVSILLVPFLHFYDVETTQFLRGVILIIGIEYCEHIQKFLETKFFLKLNEISYQLYLVHATVLASACCYVYVCFPLYSYWLALALFVVITFVLSFMFTIFDKSMNRRMNEFLYDFV